MHPCGVLKGSGVYGDDDAIVTEVSEDWRFDSLVCDGPVVTVGARRTKFSLRV